MEAIVRVRVRQRRRSILDMVTVMVIVVEKAAMLLNDACTVLPYIVALS